MYLQCILLGSFLSLSFAMGTLLDLSHKQNCSYLWRYFVMGMWVEDRAFVQETLISLSLSFSICEWGWFTSWEIGRSINKL